MRALNIIGTIAVLALAIVMSYIYVGKTRNEPVRDGDTITEYIRVYDTIYVEVPVPVDSVVLRYVTEKLPVATSDTLYAENYAQKELENIRDSSTVVMPITQKHYADSTYEAWVSGYNPELDSIKVFNMTEFVTTTIKQRPKRFGIGIQAGCGATTKGALPYIGVGISYNLWNF